MCTFLCVLQAVAALGDPHTAIELLKAAVQAGATYAALYTLGVRHSRRRPGRISKLLCARVFVCVAGNAYLMLGGAPEALECYSRALRSPDISEDGRWTVLLNIGHVYMVGNGEGFAAQAHDAVHTYCLSH